MSKILWQTHKRTRSIRSYLFQRDATAVTMPWRMGFYTARFLWMIAEDFIRNRCTQKCAALAFTSVLSLFPLMAVVSIFATFFFVGGPEEAENLIVRVMGEYVLPGDPVTAPDHVIASAPASTPASEPTSAGVMSLVPTGPSDSFDSNVRLTFRQFRRNASRIAGLGGLGLLLASMALFTACEIFFNQIWKVHVRRSLLKRFMAFSTLLVSVPFLITMGTIVTRFFHERLEASIRLPYAGPFSLWFTSFATVAAPFFFVWMALTLAIHFTPNTRVKWLPALAGGFATALLWVLIKHLYFTYIGLSPLRRSIFEAFGATLVFLVWLYFLWAIVLVGVEVAYLAQNFDVVLREDFKPEQEVLRDPRLYVLVLGRIAESFLKNEGGIKFDELRKRTNLSESQLEEIVAHLMKEKLLAVREDDRLIIDRPLENLKLNDIFYIACQGAVLAGKGAENDAVWRALSSMDQMFPRHFGQMNLRDLLQSGELLA